MIDTNNIDSKTIDNEKIQAIISRLITMRGPNDGKGAFLGDGMPSRDSFRQNIRSKEIAALLQELMEYRKARPIF